MKSLSRIGVAAFISMISFAALLHAQAEPLKDMDGLKQMFADKQYQDVIKEIARVMARRDAMKTYDQYDLFSLKGEAHLQLKQWSFAADAFGMAGKNTTDDKKSMIAKATQYLIKHSQNGLYKAKSASASPTTNPSAKGDGIDVVDPESRKTAITALMNDELANVTAKVTSLKRQGGLRAISEAMGLVRDFRPLEMAATDADTQSKQMIQDLVSTSVQMMNNALTQMSQQVDRISATANTQVETLYQNKRIFRAQGLTGKDRQDLNEVINTCGQLIPTAKDMSAAVGKTSGGELDRIATQAQTVGTHANQVLNTDYTIRR